MYEKSTNPASCPAENYGNSGPFRKIRQKQKETYAEQPPHGGKSQTVVMQSKLKSVQPHSVSRP